MTPTTIRPLGDRGFLATFPDPPLAAGWAAALVAANTPGIVDVVVAYQTVGVYADPDLVDLDQLQAQLAQRPAVPFCPSPETVRIIPTLYDGDDLAPVAAQLGLTPVALIDAHTHQDYRVLAVGFQPGFPYAGPLPPNLAGLPRRTSPRPRVSPGSVAIVGEQTAIYPSESPGGWHLIGRTPLRIVDLPTAHFPIRVGDWLRFVAIDRDTYHARLGELL